MANSNYKSNGVDLFDLFEPLRATTPGADTNYKVNGTDIKNNLMTRSVSNNGPKATNSGYKVNSNALQNIFEEIGYADGATIRLNQNAIISTVINKTDLNITNANTGNDYYPNRMLIFLRGKSGSGGTGATGENGDGSASVYGGGGGGGAGAGGEIWFYLDSTNLNQITFDGVDKFTFSIDGESSGNYPAVRVPQGSNGANGSTSNGGAGGAGGAVGYVSNDPLGLITVISTSTGKTGGAGGNSATNGNQSNYSIGEVSSVVQFNGTVQNPPAATNTPAGNAGATNQWSDVYDTYDAFGGGGGGGTPYAQTAATNGTDGDNVLYDGGNGGNGAGDGLANIIICY